MRSPLLLHGTGFAAILAVGLTATSPSASAQSFFETLFGPSKPAYAPPGANRLLPPSGINTGLPYTTRPAPQPRRREDDAGDEGYGDLKRSGGYHTVCVRLCDGFYWPISYSASRSRLHRDANACSSSCTSEAKLFHYPTNGGQMQEAVDLTGRAYSRLPTAFKYRKTLVQGCSCKAEPWSQAEMNRHRIYALNEEMAKSSDPQARAKAAAATAYPVPPPSGPQASAAVGDATELTSEPAGVAQAPQPDETEAEEAAPTVRPARSKSADPITSRQRPRPTATALRQAAARPRPQQAQSNQGGFWTSSAPKYTWPGDPPPRYR